MSQVPPRISPLDEAYGHQLVAPRLTTVHDSPHWQERCYHLLVSDTGLMLNMGRAVWPHAGLHRAFVGASDGAHQRCIRVESPWSPGDPGGTDQPTVGPITVEAVRPLEEVRLRCDTEELRVDLTWTARLPPVATSPQRIEQDGVVVTDYMNFFQSGAYHGEVELLGVRHPIEQRLGFRDRGWGVRKHEGAPNRGLVLAAFCELPDEAVYMIMFETASGRRVLTNGWCIRDGAVDHVVGIEHDLTFRTDLLSGGTVQLRLESGATRDMTIEPYARLFLAGVGYSKDPALVGPGSATFDVSDPAVREQLRGQTDHGSRFTVDGVAGHGYVETGLGIHQRYRPGA